MGGDGSERAPRYDNPSERKERIIQYPYGFIDAGPEEVADIERATRRAEALDKMKSQNYCENVERMSVKALFMKEADHRISMVGASAKRNAEPGIAIVHLFSMGVLVKKALARKIADVNVCDEEVLRVLSQRFHNYMTDLTKFSEWASGLAAVNDNYSTSDAYRLMSTYVKVNPFDTYEDSKVLLPYVGKEFPPKLQMIDAKSKNLQLENGNWAYSPGARMQAFVENLIADYDFPGIWGNEAKSREKFLKRFVQAMTGHPAYLALDARGMLRMMREAASQLDTYGGSDKDIEEKDYDRIIVGVQVAVFGTYHLPEEGGGAVRSMASAERPGGRSNPEKPKGSDRAKIIVPGQPEASEAENANEGGAGASSAQTSRPDRFRPGMDTMRSKESIETANYKFKVTPPLPSSENWADSVYDSFDSRGFAGKQNMNFVDAASEVAPAPANATVHAVEGKAIGGEFVFPMPRGYTIDDYSFSPNVGARLLVDKKSGVYKFKWSKSLDSVVNVSVRIYKKERIISAAASGEEKQKFLGEFGSKPRLNRVDLSNLGLVTDRVYTIRRYILSNFRYPTSDQDARLSKVYRNANNYFEALEQHKVADCDVANMYFVGLMRESGIPARLVAGDVAQYKVGLRPHGWAEYFDGKRWVAVDATPFAKPTLPGFKIPDLSELPREEFPLEGGQDGAKEQGKDGSNEVLPEDIFDKLRKAESLKWVLEQLKENKAVLKDPERAVASILENKNLKFNNEALFDLLKFLYRHRESSKLIRRIFDKAQNDRDFMNHIVWNLRLIMKPGKVNNTQLKNFKRFLFDESLAVMFDEILKHYLKTQPRRFAFIER